MPTSAGPGVMSSRISDCTGSVPALIVLASTAWALCVYLGQYPGYIHFDTAEIFAWSRSGFRLDTGRHPPLLPWIVHAADLVHPLGRHGLMLIAWANLTLGAYASWRLARLVVGRDRALIAVVLYGLVPYTTWLAMKLNHNSILVSLWPLTVWAFLSCLRRPTLLRGALLGVAAAAGVLAKYYTLLLLLAMLVASLWWPRRSEFYRAAAPYAAAIVFACLVGPHVYVSYVADAGAFTGLYRDAGFEHRNPLVHALQPGDRGAGAWLRMLRSNVTSLAPVLAGFAFLAWWLGGVKSRPQGRDGGGLAIVWLLAAIPYLLTIVIVAALRLTASPEWAAPVFTFVPVLLAAFLPSPSPERRAVLQRLLLVAAIALPLGGPALLYVGFKSGTQSAVTPRAEIARDAAAVWRSATGQPLYIIGPEQGLANTASLVLAERPYAWPAFSPAVAWITPGMVERHGVLVACVSGDPYCQELSKAMIQRSTVTCRLRHARTLWGARGPLFETQLYLVPPAGMRLPPASAIAGCLPDSG